MTAIPVYTQAGGALFSRSYELTIDNGDGSATQFGNTEVGSSALRMQFSVERKGAGIDLAAGGTSPGPRSLVLYNLAPTTRNKIQVNTRISLAVGYKGALSTLFVGTVRTVYSVRSGADVSTTMELLDAEPFSQGCVFQHSYAPADIGLGIRLTQILSDIADAMRLTYANKTVRVEAGVAAGIQERYYPAGIVFNGTCGQALNTLLPPLGLRWDISNGALSITPVDNLSCRPVIVMRPDTGLINIPSAKFVMGRQTVIFDSLMNTDLAPNRLVTFVPPNTIVGAGGNLSATDTLQGYFAILKTTHKGDTHGAGWDVNCEAIPYSGSLQAIVTKSTLDYSKAAGL